MVEATFKSSSWAGVPDYSKDFSNFSAKTLENEPLEVKKLDQHNLTVHNNKKSFILSYSITPEKSYDISSSEERFYVQLNHDWAFMFGSSFLLSPSNQLLLNKQTIIHIVENRYNSFLTTIDQHSSSLVYRHLFNAWYFAGEHEASDFQLDEKNIQLILQGKNWSTPIDEWTRNMESIARLQFNIFDFYPINSFKILMLKGKEGVFNGTTVSGGIQMVLSPTTRDISENFNPLNLFAHEHFHNINHFPVLFPALFHCSPFSSIPYQTFYLSQKDTLTQHMILIKKWIPE